ncbi:MAG: DUF4115 domain-containing protein [Elusimicrobia bacterium]|nr:DUF4115 domain-containing protein [Candidatus Liberimonas magnetica]
MEIKTALNNTTMKIGKSLKDRRAAKNISIEAINQETRIPKIYIKAIEEGDMSKFSADVYYTGSLRKYASYLGLNANELVDQYLNEKSAAKNELKAKTEKKEKASLKRILVAALAVLFLWAAAFISILSLNKINENKSVNKSKISAVKENELLKPKHLKKNELDLEVKAISSTWIRVKSDGNLVFENVLPAGEKRNWIAKENLVLRIGYVPGVEVSLNGKRVDTMIGAKEYINEIQFTKESLKKEKQSKDVESPVKKNRSKTGIPPQGRSGMDGNVNNGGIPHLLQPSQDKGRTTEGKRFSKESLDQPEGARDLDLNKGPREIQNAR